MADVETEKRTETVMYSVNIIIKYYV